MSDRFDTAYMMTYTPCGGCADRPPRYQLKPLKGPDHEGLMVCRKCAKRPEAVDVLTVRLPPPSRPDGDPDDL